MKLPSLVGLPHHEICQHLCAGVSLAQRGVVNLVSSWEGFPVMITFRNIKEGVLSFSGGGCVEKGIPVGIISMKWKMNHIMIFFLFFNVFF